MAKKGQPVSEVVFEKIEQETKNLLAKAVPAPDKQLCLFEGWADWNAEQAANPPLLRRADISPRDFC